MFQGMPEVEDLTTSYKHVGPIPDPFGPIADNHHDGVSAHPAQFPELGVQAPENLVSVSQASDQKSPHHRTAAWRGFHTLLRQQQDASLDLAKTPFFDNGQGRQPLLADAAAAMAAHLHSQHTAVHSQYHHRGRILYLRTRTAAVGVIAAQLVTVDRGRLPQPLGDPPNTHGTDGDAQQQPGQPCRQGIRSDAGQQSQQSGQGAGHAPWFHPQDIQQGPALVRAVWTTIARHGNSQPSEPGQPGDRTGIVRRHRPPTVGTRRDGKTCRLRHGVDFFLQRL